MRFEPCRQHQMPPQFFHRLIDCKSRGIGGNLKEHLAGLTKIDGVKILAIHHGCDVVLSQRPAEPVALALNQSKAHVDPPNIHLANCRPISSKLLSKMPYLLSERHLSSGFGQVRLDYHLSLLFSPMPVKLAGAKPRLQSLPPNNWYSIVFGNRPYHSLFNVEDFTVIARCQNGKGAINVKTDD